MLLPDSNQLKLGTVSGYKRESEGFLLGSTTPNPLLNSRMYQVTFTDGNICDFAANAIAEAIYSQHDDEGNKYTLIKEIVSHEKGKNATTKHQVWLTSHTGNKRMVKTTKGWKLCVAWKDGTTS